MKLHERKRLRARLAKELTEMKGARRTLAAEYRALGRKIAGEDNPADTDMTRLDEMQGQISDHDDKIAGHEQQLAEHDEQIGRIEAALNADDGESTPLDGEGDKNGGVYFEKSGGHGTGEREQPVTKKGAKAARFIAGILMARSGEGKQAAAEWVSRTFKDDEVAKALNTTGVSTGGALIPQNFVNEVIELLRAETVVRALDPRIIQMPGGNMTMPRMIGGATAGYQGELDDMSSSQETFDDLQFNAKKLTALVPVTNDLLRRSPIDIEAIIRDDMVQTVARREDLAFLLGDGSGNSPVGFLNLCSAANKLIAAPFADATNATILTNVIGVLLGMRLTMKNNFSRMLRPAWIMTPTTEFFLLGLRDQVGNFMYREEMVERGTVDGVRYKVTQQLPTNITANLYGSGTANDGAYLILVDMADVILAETFKMSVDASTVAAYKDSAGNMVSAFTRDQTAFRIIEEHDLNIRHQGSLCVALLPAWAPAGWSNWGSGGAYYVQAPSGDMSAAPSTWGVAAPTGSSNPGNSSAVAPGGTLPGRA